MNENFYITLSHIVVNLDMLLASEGGGMRSVCESQLTMQDVTSVVIQKQNNVEQIDIELTIRKDKGKSDRKLNIWYYLT